jgi:hypothetical protein
VREAAPGFLIQIPGLLHPNPEPPALSPKGFIVIIWKWKTIPLLAFSLAAISCDSTTSSPAGNTKTTAGDIPHPCQVLTSAQIQAAVGVAVTDNQPDTLGDVYSCYYGADYTQADGVPNLYIAIRTDNSILADGSHSTAAEHYNHFHSQVVAAKTTVVSPTSYYIRFEGQTEDVLIEEVSGLGSSAFYYDADKPSVQLWVLKDYAELNFLIHLPANLSGSEKEHLKTAANQFIAAMP